MLKEFFAVTRTSVYHVKAGVPTAIKIAVRGASDVVVGGQLHGGTMIAICASLVAYIPEGSGLFAPTSTVERRIEKVNPFYFGGHSSPIIALFETQDEALSCFNEKNLQDCDPRFQAQTRAVCDAIGDDHPDFYVCKLPDICLRIFDK